jgi:hypothetical protein
VYGLYGPADGVLAMAGGAAATAGLYACELAVAAFREEGVAAGVYAEYDGVLFTGGAYELCCCCCCFGWVYAPWAYVSDNYEIVRIMTQ